MDVRGMNCIIPTIALKFAERSSNHPLIGAIYINTMTIGIGFKDAFGVNMAGLDVMTLPQEQASILRQEYRTVAQTGKPHWRSYTAWFEDRMQTSERLSLPLADKSGKVSMILVCAYQVH